MVVERARTARKGVVEVRGLRVAVRRRRGAAAVLEDILRIILEEE